MYTPRTYSDIHLPPTEKGNNNYEIAFQPLPKPINSNRLQGTALDGFQNFENVMNRIKEESKANIEREEEQVRLQEEIMNSRNLLIKKSQEEIAILKLTIDEQKLNYETRLSELAAKYDEKILNLTTECEFKVELKAEAEKARLNALEAQFRSKYERKLKSYEEMVSQAMTACKNKEISAHGSVVECRREITELKLSFDSKEKLYREELRLKDLRLSDIQQKLQTFLDVQQYGKIWKDNAINFAYAYLQLCATSTIKVEEKDNFTEYLSSFDKIFVNKEKLPKESENEVCVDKSKMKKLLKQAKVSILLY